MARQIGQQMRFNDLELSLMKNTFAENEDFLFIIRKVLLQFPLDVMEADQLKGFMTDGVYTLLKKAFLPALDPDAPLFQLVDLQMGLNVDFKSYRIDEMGPYIESKQLVIEYLEQQFEVLKDSKSKMPISLAKMGDLKDQNAAINILSRNYILSYVDSNLQQIKFLAGKKEESVEDTKDRLKKDSSK
jgi:hypothetical protein